MTAVRCLLTLLFAVLVAGPLATAQAHTGLVDSDPADGAVLRRPPQRLTLTFTAPPLDQGMAVRAVGPSGSFAMQPAVAGSRVVAPWPRDQRGGQFRLSFRVVAADGHPITGTVTFRIKGPGSSPQATRTAAPATGALLEDSPTGSVPGWLWLGGGVVVAAAVALIVVAGRGEHGS